MTRMEPEGPPRIESLSVRNFRALRKIDLKDLTPLTVLIGPNGSGKSTVFDVFAFLSECFEDGLRRAWDKRGRLREIKSRGSSGPIVIEIKYRERPSKPGSTASPRITYRLELDEIRGRPVVAHEWLGWRRGRRGRPFGFLESHKGSGRATSGELPDKMDEREPFKLRSPDLLAVNALGQFSNHPRVAKLRDFITGWHISYLAAEEGRGQPESGPHEKLTRTGDNLANVVQHLHERTPRRLRKIIRILADRVPLIAGVKAEPMPDGRLLLQFVDDPFDEPILARYASDGTLKMLAYLILLHGSHTYPFIGIEEPENFLHPNLLPILAEECRSALRSTQLLITTHSPFFLDGLDPKEVRILWRDNDGYTCVRRASDIEGIADQMDSGGMLGNLWTEGWFGVGDPLTRL